MSKYKPGTVALALVHGADVLITLDPNDDWFAHEETHGRMWLASDEVTNIRPLNVLADDEVAVKADDLRLARESMGEGLDPGYEWWRDGPMAALRAHDATRTPQIEEPQGLGAVVEDAEGERAVRHVVIANSTPWRFHDSDWRAWADIKAVRVLSEGVDV